MLRRSILSFDSQFVALPLIHLQQENRPISET